MQLIKGKIWVHSRCKWQVRMTKPDPFGNLNEIVFLERNRSEAKRRYSHAAWRVTEFTARNHRTGRVFAQLLLCRTWRQNTHNILDAPLLLERPNCDISKHKVALVLWAGSAVGAVLLNPSAGAITPNAEEHSCMYNSSYLDQSKTHRTWQLICTICYRNVSQGEQSRHLGCPHREIT